MTAAALREPSIDYARGLARAFGGALLFAFPLLMTMEMWFLGFTLDPLRLILFVLLSLPLIYGLAYYSGFRSAQTFRDHLLDALSALFVGFVVAVGLLALFGVIGPGQPPDEIAGKIALQTVPGAMGATLARKQLAGRDGEAAPDPIEEADHRAGYLSELFLMAAGALFVVLNVAPTEEMVLISYMMSPWQTLGLIVLSLGVLHAIVYTLGFAGQHPHERPWLAFIHFTVPGYVLVLAVGLYVQWTFGHVEGHSLAPLLATTVVLAFPGAIGAGAARLLI